ncbi:MULTISPECIES: lysophospholipid acyltransferase family protein [unclassified Endozoicomonas]|uniref:lysophospholipid acyltransferase family protein n=1 Tax=unclassified Endozoicomonas TaxID=2644528 RepID=UPI0021475B28|nr:MULTISPECIES: lysophospholipid acyltransferase family protein [unclassified Endozoicomonas]
MTPESSPFRLPKKTRSGIPEAAAEWLLGLKTIDQIYKKEVNEEYPSDDFLKLVLKIFNIQHQVASGRLDSIPATGSSVIVANHPFGGIEGVALADLLLQIRPDVKVLTNELLCRIHELKGLFIGVDIISTNVRKKNVNAIEEARKWVAEGHQLLIFPAGEVSSLDLSLKQVTDPKWRNTAARIIRQTQAKVTPVFIDGQNGWLFQAMGLIHPRLRTVRLIRELLNKRGSTLSFRIGRKLDDSDYQSMSSDSALTNYLRLHTYLLSTHKPSQTKRVSMPPKERKMQPIVDPVSPERLQANIKQLPEDCLLLEKGEMIVYCARSGQLPEVLPEIGRLREVTFRGVGEGTGKPRDLDQYDEDYLHLFLWNQKEEKIMGAYRIGQVDQILRSRGVHGIYSRSLFRYHAEFIHKLGSCLEMGRSFVVPEYQRSLSALMMLWKGIGAYVAANPWYKVLFGPVSISSDYSEASRQLMAGCLSVNNSDAVFRDLVQPTTPLKAGKGRFWNQADLLGLTDFETLSSLVQQIEEDNKGIPILLKQYLKLHGELVAFNVDPNFNNALDGLIIVDLLKVDERTLNKYMGVAGARAFLTYNRPAA